MTSKTHKIAHLAALLAVHTTKSAHTCADLAIKLNGLGAAISAVYTFECNGYKNDRQDQYLNKLSRTDKKAAIKYCNKLNSEGAAYCEKRKAQIEKKLSAICADTGLNIETANLSGLVWRIDPIREYYI